MSLYVVSFSFKKNKTTAGETYVNRNLKGIAHTLDAVSCSQPEAQHF